MSRTILVVDAELQTQNSILEILTGAAYKVLATDTGSEGLNLARGGGVDLIVLAVELPDQNGFVLFSRLKKIPQTMNIPIILTSSSASQEVFENHLQLPTHADGYFIKPLNLEILLEEIQAILGDEYHDELAHSSDGEALLFDAPEEVKEESVGEAPSEEMIDLIEIHDEMLPVVEHSDLLGDLGFDKLDIYDAMGTVEVGDAVADRLPSLSITEVRENSGLLLAPVEEKKEAEAGLEEKGQVSAPAGKPLKLPPLAPKSSTSLQSVERNKLQEQIETLKIIENTQQETIERQLDEITELKSQLSSMEASLAANNSDKQLEELQKQLQQMAVENEELMKKNLRLELLIQNITELITKEK